MSAKDKLVKLAEENRTILCFGIDPDIDRIGAKVHGAGKPEETIGPFFHSMMERLLDENAISAIKPNYAFFAQYGFGGLYVLEDLIQHYSKKTFVILDAKRGDIGKTGEAYAREVFDFWGADAVTISPYMGSDSVKPFLRNDRLAYVLCRTSNPGARDFQELRLLGKGAPKQERYLYEAVAAKGLEWDCGLVVGATSDAIKKLALETGNRVPMLIPGIGAQGGDLAMVMDAIKGNPAIHRINASSSIAYAFEKHGGSPADAAAMEAQRLNETIRKRL